ncbi:hypothetical protein DND90_12920 [Pseudomonas syringae pv. maculicola]|nr:hypothetical protein DND90_12920 [Pseudomonas syringae pv. maculicola]
MVAITNALNNTTTLERKPDGEVLRIALTTIPIQTAA